MTNFAITPVGGATAVNNATSLIFSAGEAKTFYVSTSYVSPATSSLQDCTGQSGRYVSYSTTITYSDGPLAGKVQTGAKPLLVLCQ